MIFDFHTHQTNVSRKGIWNYRVGIEKNNPPQNTWFSAGIHPWDVEELDLEVSYLEFENHIQNKDCICIGEIGLDKHFGTNLALQIEVFKRQLEIAADYPKKVLIIHCVKAYQELIQLKKESKTDFIWVIHGFQASWEMMESLKNQGFYFSIGSSVLNHKSKVKQYINKLPLDRLFLETDNSSHSINEVYKAVSNALEMDVFEVSLCIDRNLNKILQI